MLRVAAVSLAIFAVYLPVAIFVHRDYVQPPRPDGRAVEMILKFEPQGSQYATVSYVFNLKSFPDAPAVLVYEDMQPLPTQNVEIVRGSQTYVFRILTGDGSDPRTNGRQYWLVARH